MALYNFVLRDRNFQEPLGKPGKKRAALAHFDTIFSLDKIMVQLTIQAVLVSRRIIQLSKFLNKGCQYSLGYDQLYQMGCNCKIMHKGVL